MTKSTLFDRLNQELEAFGKKAQAALDEGKLQIELLRSAAGGTTRPGIWGCWCYRRERGGEVEPRRVDALLLRLDDLEAEIDPAGAADRRGTSAPAAGNRRADPAGSREPTAGADASASGAGQTRPIRPGPRARPGSGPGSCRTAHPRPGAPAARGRRPR